jgi:hypothetical protein
MSSSRKIDIVQPSFEHGLGWVANFVRGRLGLRAVRLLKAQRCINTDFQSRSPIDAGVGPPNSRNFPKSQTFNR